MTTVTISPENFEKALKVACLRAASQWAREEPYRGGDQTAVRYGPLISDIADEADLSIPQTRRRLQAVQLSGKVIRDDHRGGSTAWWLVGLADAQRVLAPAVAAPAPAPARQAFTAPVLTRQHWSDVLGVARDASTSEVREARERALAAVNEFDLDAAQQRERIQSAYTARLTEDGISEYE